MRLRTKTVITLIPLTLLFVFLTNSLGASIIVGQALDEDNSRSQAAAAEIDVGLQDKISQIDRLCSDWGVWDDAWYYVQYHNTTFSDQILAPDSLLTYDLDALLFLNVTGELVGGIALDKVNGTVTAMPTDLLAIIHNDTSLKLRSNITDHREGLLSLENGSAMFSSRPVVRTDLSGGVMGTIIMISYVDQATASSISRLNGASLSVGSDISDPQMLRNLGSDKLVTSYQNDSTMASSWLVQDIYGKPSLSLTLEVKRSAYLSVKDATLYMTEAVLAAGVVNFILMVVFVERGILSRLHKIMDDINKIGTGERKERRVRLMGDDELRDLGIQVNTMLESLDRSDNEIILREKKYRTIVEASSNAIFIAGKQDRRLIDVNPAFLRMTGNTVEMLGSMSLADVLVVPEHWYEQGTSWPGSAVLEGYGQLIHSDSTTSEVEVSRSNLLLDGMDVECYIAKDVTERRKAEREKETILEQLKRANEKLEITLRSIADGVITIDRQGIIILGNRAAEEMIGQKMDTITGRSIKEVLDLPDKQWDTISSIASGGPLRNEARNPNGSNWLMEYSFTTLLGNQNEAVGKVFVFRDISEKIRAEIAEANADRLESIGTLAGGIAHDFNNLMTSVMGEMFLLRSEIDQSESSMKRSIGRLDDMETAMDRAKFVAQELLSLSKGGSPIQKPTMLKVMLEDTARLAFTGSNLNWTLECPDDLWTVNIDSGQMNRAFLNILFNAQEASPAASKVRIIASNFEGVPPGLAKGRYVVLVFIDQRAGIPPEVLPRIFDPYFTTKETGSGLGMTVTYSTVKRHGGVIDVTSDVGKGTKVTIFLPAVQSNVEPRPAQPKAVTGSGRILIMDDEEFILEVTGEVLRELGYEVEVSTDGLEALKVYEEAIAAGKRFDAVIMDLTIPGGMGGKEAISRLLEIDRNAKAIVSSGYSNDPVMANFRDHGFVVVVPKPYKIEELSHTLKEVLTKKTDD